MIGDFDMKLTHKLLGQYKRASKMMKGQTLTEYCQLTEVSRNTASKRFRKQIIRSIYPRVLPPRAVKKPGPKKKFSGVHVRVVKGCWELAGGICAERLHPVLCAYIDQLEIRGMLGAYSKGDIAVAKAMSLVTLKRAIATFPRSSSKEHKGNAMIYKQVPIVANFGKFTDEPGFVEIDYVEHNGGTSSGLFAITGTYTDIFCGWTARAAGLGKNLSSVTSIDKVVHTRIVHPVVHYHPDNDKTTLRILFDKMKDNNDKQGRLPFALSRSRPYKKNDNAHVEQKNDG
jgi:hypothetical protein